MSIPYAFQYVEYGIRLKPDLGSFSFDDDFIGAQRNMILGKLVGTDPRARFAYADNAHRMHAQTHNTLVDFCFEYAGGPHIFLQLFGKIRSRENTHAGSSHLAHGNIMRMPSDLLMYLGANVNDAFPTTQDCSRGMVLRIEQGLSTVPLNGHAQETAHEHFLLSTEKKYE